MTDQQTEPTDSLRLSISAPGTLWAFRIAQEVERRGGEVNIYTTEPSFLRDRQNTIATVDAIYHPFIIKQIGYQLPLLNQLFEFSGYNRPFERWGNYLFDQAVAHRLERPSGNTELFLGFAGGCRDSLQRANDLGYATAVERSSTHIRTQREILQEEYDRYGVAGQPISHKHVAREEQEYEEADYIITPSEFTAQSFRDRGVPSEKLIQIPFGTIVDFELPNRETDDTVRFLYAGEASLRKGIQYLLPAWERASVDDAELLIAGRLSDAVSDIVAQYEADDSVKFLGWVDDIDSLYESASVFVLPTLEEGSARVTYEAMAWELPVVTTPNSGWVGSDGEHGIEVPIRSVETLMDAIETLYTDTALRRLLGGNGRELVATEYTWDDYGGRVWEAYQKMVAP